MDRIETYVGQSILEWNFSKPDQNKMVALGKIIASLFGTGTVVNGLACSQQAVATMSVNIGAGEIYQQAQLEATVCGTLPADTTHTISKQGILLDAVVVPNYGTGITALTAPGTSGQSINYLIEAAYADLDVSIDPTTGASPVVLPFYNTNNSQTPLQGPGGAGTTSNTFRKGIVSLQVKAGIAAATGSQVTPAPDAGYVGLWVVTVAFGQTTVTNSNISQFASAPILPASLLSMVQTDALKYGIDVGSVNTIQAVYPIPPTSLGENQPFWVKIKATNTGPMTFTPNAGVIAASPVVGGAHAALQGGECVANGRALLIWRADITSYVLAFCTGAAEQIGTGTASQQASTVGQVQTNSLTSAVAGGTVNALTATIPSSLTALTGNQRITLTAAYANTAALPASLILTLGSTVLPSYPIVKGNNQPLVAGDIPGSGYPITLNWSQGFGAYVMQNPATGIAGLPSPFYKVDGQSVIFTKTGAGTLQIKAGTIIGVAGTVVNFSAATNVIMPALTAGTDYAVYVCTDRSIRADANLSTPTGYTTANSLKIGGFHYGLVAPATTIAGGSFATTGNGMIWTQPNVDDIAGINKYSLWDLKFRPACTNPGGMVLVGGRTWVDIYLCNTSTDTNGTSMAGSNIASGTVFPKIPAAFGGNGATTYPTLNWWVANELARSNQKRMMWEHEFVDAAFGVTENQSIDATASTYPTTMRNPGYTSKYGIEQAAGVQWTWGQDTGMYYDSTTWSYKDVNGNGGAGTGRGQVYTEGSYGLTRVILGGARAYGSISGSRASDWSLYPWGSGWNIGLRAACDHLQSV